MHWSLVNQIWITKVAHVEICMTNKQHKAKELEFRKACFAAKLLCKQYEIYPLLND
jgi:hypothetical protein